MDYSPSQDDMMIIRRGRRSSSSSIRDLSPLPKVYQNGYRKPIESLKSNLFGAEVPKPPRILKTSLKKNSDDPFAEFSQAKSVKWGTRKVRNFGFETIIEKTPQKAGPESFQNPGLAVRVDSSLLNSSQNSPEKIRADQSKVGLYSWYKDREEELVSPKGSPKKLDKVVEKWVPEFQENMTFNFPSSVINIPEFSMVIGPDVVEASNSNTSDKLPDSLEDQPIDSPPRMRRRLYSEHNIDVTPPTAISAISPQKTLGLYCSSSPRNLSGTARSDEDGLLGKRNPRVWTENQSKSACDSPEGSSGW